MSSLPDPHFVKQRTCTQCTSPMGGVRVHEGTSGHQDRRGRIVQTCSNARCHWTFYHTEQAYLMEDAEALVQRYDALSLGFPVPPQFLGVPLRLAHHPEPPEAANGAIPCTNANCKTAGGNRTRGSQQCIDFKCKNCCQAEADAAETAHRPRDPCKVHKVRLVSDRRVQQTPAPVPPPPTQQNTPAPVPPPPTQQNTSVPTRNVPQPSSVRRRPLAQPLGPLWQNNHQASNEAKTVVENTKTRRLDMQDREKRTIDLFLYHTAKADPLILRPEIKAFPRLELAKDLPFVVTSLKLTEESLLDHWSHGSWKTVFITSVLTVDADRPTLLKIRHSLLEALALDDCPGLADELARYPSVRASKRTGDFDSESISGSPLKKSAKKSSSAGIGDASQAAHVLLDHNASNDAHPPTPPAPKSLPPAADSEPSPLPKSTAFPGVPPMALESSNISDRASDHRWYQEMPICRWDAGWKEITDLQKTDPAYKHIKKAFPKAFDHRYVKASVHKYKTFWDKKVPDVLKKKYIAMGEVPNATWAHILLEAASYSADTDIAANLPSTSESIATENLHQTVESVQEPAPFPHMSPLSGVVTLPSVPLNTIISMKTEPMDDEMPPDPDTLCPFCDQQLPNEPSQELIELRAMLEDISVADPLPENPGHRKPTSYMQVQSYCERHRMERDTFPLARAEKWPFNPNFSDLFKRVLASRAPLNELLEEIENSSFFRASRAHYTPPSTSPGTRQMSMTQLLYGEIGYEIVMVVLRFLFPDTPNIVELCTPLPYDVVLREVLLPETMVRIIQEDLQVGPRAAKSIIRSSHLFGTLLHPASVESPVVDEVNRYITEQRSNSAYRTWISSGSRLSLEDWIEQQRVKSEPVEVLIPMARGFVSGTSLAEPIDLTLSDDDE
ncbi:hypothetical protein GGX14DRAFT_376152 [Mycena pura]|uniref:Restriction of telomere capping protein 4 n=1 Tax=Mycena pura TaxID=153505 RepID=A0AAD6UWH9_9AGAR|nr:hypothetical protein GGX14DRAFT_376152 [Mycena pura]